MARHAGRYSKLRYLLLYSDSLLVLLYLAFRKEALDALLAVYGVLTSSFELADYQFLVWGGFLFTNCALFSYLRSWFSAKQVNSSKGVVLFESMVVGAVTLAVGKAISQAHTIDPYWLVEIGFSSYVFEVVTTAGAGYVFADLIWRIHSFVRK